LRLLLVAALGCSPLQLLSDPPRVSTDAHSLPESSWCDFPFWMV
jgi:hypothetical protein